MAEPNRPASASLTVRRVSLEPKGARGRRAGGSGVRLPGTVEANRLVLAQARAGRLVAAAAARASRRRGACGTAGVGVPVPTGRSTGRGSASRACWQRPLMAPGPHAPAGRPRRGPLPPLLRASEPRARPVQDWGQRACDPEGRPGSRGASPKGA